MTILAIVDDCTRECLALVADTSLSGFHDTENATTEEKGLCSPDQLRDWRRGGRMNFVQNHESGRAAHGRGRDIVDLALSYFVWCHSLREWLVRGKVMDAKVLDENLGRYPQWKICRDIANRCRHYDLTTNPSDKHWSIGREYDPFANPENRLPCQKWFLSAKKSLNWVPLSGQHSPCGQIFYQPST